MQITLNIPDAQVPRVKAMVRARFPEFEEDGVTPFQITDAELLADFKQSIRRWIKGEVQQYELLEQHKAIFEQYTQLEVTD